MPQDVCDRVDLNIIKLLQENSRESLRKIGSRLGLSDVAVHYRIKKMLQNKVIRKFTILIEPEKLGFSVRATMGIQVDPPLLDEVAHKIAQHPSFYMVWMASGAHNIHAEAAFEDNAEMQNVLSEFLHKLKGVKEYHMSIMIKPVKEDYSLSERILRSQSP